MALDDRERNFEKALRRELRADGAKGLDCPDAETLAAYHERMLSPEEMASQKSHIADCPRCQEILATLEMTEAVSAGAEDSEKILEMSAKRAAVVATPAAPLTTKRSSAKEMPKRSLSLRWAVAAGAIAAGLLIWIAIGPNRTTMTKKPQESVQMAENRESTNSELSKQKMQSAGTPAAAPAMADKVSRNAQSPRNEELDAFAPAGAGVGEGSGGGRGRAATPRTYDHGPRVAQNQMTQNQMAQNQTAQNQALQSQVQEKERLESKNQTTELKRPDDLPTTGRDSATFEYNARRQGAPAKKALPPAAPLPAPAVVGGASGAGAGKQKEKNKDEPVSQVSQTVTAQSEAVQVTDGEKVDADKAAAFALNPLKETQVVGGVAAAKLLNTKTGGPGLIKTPNPKVLWFFTTNGMVFRSDDGGKTTKLQKTGEGMKFLAGSAPDANTCWLLAEKGIVLHTSNGGKKWTNAIAPANQNFTMITGLDATHALITDTVARVSYSTADGGATWTVVQKP